MPPIISYGGQKNRTQANVVEQPAFLRSDQKPLKWWAQNGLIYCVDPNRPNRPPTYSQPLDALQRVATGIKIYIKDIDEHPNDYCVTRAVLSSFFNDFKTKVFDVALEQDAQNGSLIHNTRKDYERQKQTIIRETQEEAHREHEKRTKIFLPPKS